MRNVPLQYKPIITNSLNNDVPTQQLHNTFVLPCHVNISLEYHECGPLFNGICECSGLTTA